MLKLRKNKKGFTLVELIVVIAIMAVLAGTVAGVTVSQLNKQTNNTAKAEAQTLASDLYNFMIDYRLPKNPAKPGGWDEGAAIDSLEKMVVAVQAFVDENNQGDNIKVVKLDNKGNLPDGKTKISGDSYTVKDKIYKSGDHKFYAVVYEETAAAATNNKPAVLSVRFCCEQKGSGKSQFPFADYTYSDVLADK